MMGMFPVANHPAVMLFDSGASHSFINRIFVVKHEIPIGETKKNFFIQSPGGRLCTKEMVYQVPINLGGHNFFHYHDYPKGSGYRYNLGNELDVPA